MHYLFIYLCQTLKIYTSVQHNINRVYNNAAARIFIIIQSDVCGIIIGNRVQLI